MPRKPAAMDKPVPAPAARKKAARPSGSSTKAAPSLKTAARSAARAAATPAVKPARRPKAAPVTQIARSQESRTPLVRDSFTMPEQEYAVLLEVKQACLRAGIDVKKSELLRIAIALLGQIDMPTLKRVLAALPQLKTGRPAASTAQD